MSTNIFDEQKISVLTKALKISPEIKGKTLGYQSSSFKNNKPLEAFDVDEPNFQSTPIKEKKTISNLQKTLFQATATPPSRRLLKIQCGLHELEKQDILEVNNIFSTITNNFTKTTDDINEKLAVINLAECEEIASNRIRLEEEKYKELMNLDKMTTQQRVLQQEKIDKVTALRNSEREEKIKQAKLLEKMKLDIVAIHHTFLQEFYEIRDKVKMFKNQEEFRNYYIKIKQYNHLLENIRARCKSRDVNEDLLNQAKEALSFIKNINELIDKRIQEYNNEKELEAQLAKEKLANEQKLEEEKKLETTNLVTSGLKTYVKYRTLIRETETQLEQFSKDERLKEYRFSLQKALSIPLNAISPLNGQHMLDKYVKLKTLLTGGNTGNVSATNHPLGILYCKNLLAQKFVLLGDVTVSSKPESAYALASVLITIWSELPDFGELVKGHFYTVCPYLIPAFLPQFEGQSDVDYYKSLGYQYLKSDGIEKQDKYLKRMAGFMKLYAALIISQPRNKKENPIGGLRVAWTWLANMLNLEPQSDICAVLILEMLEVVGSEMLNNYNVQFKKMLAYICIEYFPRLEKVTPSDSQGPLSRLETFLQKVIKESTIAKPSHTLPPDFW